MREKNRDKRILLIDRQDEWRKRSATALEEHGFIVQTRDTYDYPLPDDEDQPPDLVILGCASIEGDEQKLIARVLKHRDHLLVLSTKLPWPKMRSIFLAGANDVADKPYDANRLIEIVGQAFKNIEPRNND